MIRHASIVAVCMLAGCATSPAGLARSEVEKTYASAKSPQQVAVCTHETMIGNNQIANQGDHYWVLRMNGYGVPTARWDFHPVEGGGTRIELRSSIPINTGDERVENCL